MEAAISQPQAQQREKEVRFIFQPAPTPAARVI